MVCLVSSDVRIAKAGAMDLPEGRVDCDEK
jgi:hypothetical protein